MLRYFICVQSRDPPPLPPSTIRARSPMSIRAVRFQSRSTGPTDEGRITLPRNLLIYLYFVVYSIMFLTYSVVY